MTNAVCLPARRLFRRRRDGRRRAQVRGGGRKPYKQKGTGRARQGSTRSPLKVGGGVTFGPKPKNWANTKLNKKEAKLAVRACASRRDPSSDVASGCHQRCGVCTAQPIMGGCGVCVTWNGTPRRSSRRGCKLAARVRFETLVSSRTTSSGGRVVLSSKRLFWRGEDSRSGSRSRTHLAFSHLHCCVFSLLLRSGSRSRTARRRPSSCPRSRRLSASPRPRR